MSYEIGEVGNDGEHVSITGFHGGVHRGRCVQLTQGEQYVQLTEHGAAEVLALLLAWVLRGLAEERRR